LTIYIAYIHIYIPILENIVTACCELVGLDNKPYKMHGTYIQTVKAPFCATYPGVQNNTALF